MASIGDVTRPAFAYDQATDTWVPVGIGPHSHTASGVGAVATSSFAAKGDLLVGTGAGTLATQTVGANGTVLTADSAEADGVKWAVPAAGANWTLVNAGGTSLTGATTITVSGITDADKIMISVIGASAGASSGHSFRLNADSGSNYNRSGLAVSAPSTYSTSVVNFVSGINSTSFPLAAQSSDASSTIAGYALISGCNAAGVKVWQSVGSGTPGSGNGQFGWSVGGWYNSTSTISSISIISDSGNYDAGTIYVYKSA